MRFIRKHNNYSDLHPQTEVKIFIKYISIAVVALLLWDGGMYALPLLQSIKNSQSGHDSASCCCSDSDCCCCNGDDENDKCNTQADTDNDDACGCVTANSISLSAFLPSAELSFEAPEVSHIQADGNDFIPQTNLREIFRPPQISC